MRVLFSCCIGVMLLGLAVRQLDNQTLLVRQQLLDSNFLYSFRFANDLVDFMQQSEDRAHAYALLACLDVAFVVLYTFFFLLILLPSTHKWAVPLANAPYLLAIFDLLETCTTPLVILSYLPRVALWIPVCCTPLKWMAAVACSGAVMCEWFGDHDEETLFYEKKKQ